MEVFGTTYLLYLESRICLNGMCWRAKAFFPPPSSCKSLWLDSFQGLMDLFWQRRWQRADRVPPPPHSSFFFAISTLYYILFTNSLSSSLSPKFALLTFISICCFFWLLLWNISVVRFLNTDMWNEAWMNESACGELVYEAKGWNYFIVRHEGSISMLLYKQYLPWQRMGLSLSHYGELLRLQGLSRILKGATRETT